MAASKGNEIIAGVSILPRYLVGGHWKTKIIKKMGKRSFTKSGVARVYIAYPPPEGWKGGDPRLNGLGGGKSAAAKK